MMPSRCRFKTFILLSCAIAAAPTVPAQATVNDPLVNLYIFPDAVDNGAADRLGVATAVHCTNFSSTTENIHFVLFQNTGRCRL
jgi:hypothetical protein